jgi:branched-chain amino acid transport system ATP-binding protein
VLSVSGLDVSIGAIAVLREVRLELPSGSMAGLIGRNGAGKTTLMRSIMGLLPARRGSVQFDGKELLKLAPHRRTALGIGYMPEDRRLIPELTVEENILLPAWVLRDGSTAGRLKTIYEQIAEIRHMAQRKAVELSGGQQKLVALGRALMCGRKLLLLDEPFEGVAPVLAQRIGEIIGGLRQQGMSILLSESDLQHSAGMLDKVFRIERGEVREESPAVIARFTGEPS